MIIFETFSPTHFTPNAAIMASVNEHRTQIGEVPKFRLLRQIVKAKVKTTYPKGWRFK